MNIYLHNDKILAYYLYIYYFLLELYILNCQTKCNDFLK